MRSTTFRQSIITLFQALYIIMLCYFYLFGFTLFAQTGINPHFEYLSADDGLSENSVTSILQDRHGFIWIGTFDGLNRYDGYSFKIFRHDPDDPNSLSYNSIEFIFEDSRGGIWVNTKDVPTIPGSKQLNRLDRSTGKFERFEYDPNDSNSITSGWVEFLFEDSRSNLWVATKNYGLNRYDWDTGKFMQFKHDPNDPNSISSDTITKIFEDSKNNLWICTEGGGINHFDYHTHQFHSFQFDENKPENKGANSVFFIVEDSRGILWMDNWAAGMNRLDPVTGAYTRYYHDPDDQNSISSNIVSVPNILEDSEGTLWVGTEDGLNRLDQNKGRFERFKYEPANPNSLSNNYINVIYEDTRKDLWIGTRDGLNRFDRTTGKFERFQNDSEKSSQICNNNVLNIGEDQAGNFWVKTQLGFALLDRKNGSFNCFNSSTRTRMMTTDISGNIWFGSGFIGGRGLVRMDLITANFQHFYHDPKNLNSLTDNLVWPILEDSDGDVWIGRIPAMGTPTSIEGLDRLDRGTGNFEQFKHDPEDESSIAKNEVFGLFEDSEGFLWIGYNMGVLDRMDRRTGKVVERYWRKQQDSTTISIGPVFLMLEDESGNLWFGGGNGINKLDRKSGLFLHFVPFPDAENPWSDNMIESIIMDSEGYLWVGTLNKGLCRMDPNTGQFDCFENDPDDPSSLSHNGVWALHEDTHKNIWAGTASGLNLLDRSTGKFTHYFEKDGLTNAYFYGILEDDHGHLWMSTNNGISRFDPQTETFHKFDVHDGLQGNQFNFFSYFKSPRTGELFFGGNNGFNIFHPDSIKVDTFAPPVAITSFTHYHKKDGHPIVDDFISEKEKITLSHYDNNLTFAFAALNFRKMAKNQYKYQLDGLSDQWYDLGNKREVTFTDLRPGEYTLRAMAANSDGVWSRKPAELSIQVLAPWWWSLWTKLVYVSILGGALYGIYRLLLNRKLTLVEARQLKEMDAVKTKFYTNITHEFRTPLTVIQGLSDHTIEKKGQVPPDKNMENAQIIKRNSAQLLTMVNQMLDLRRLESGTLPVNLVQGDIIQYLRYLTESFYSYAYEKEVGLHFMTELDEFVIDYDPDKLLHIVSNLLSNAIKFTPEGGNVYFMVNTLGVSETPRVLTIKIKDTGIGIAEDQLPFIYDRFYQANQHLTQKGEGTGIGLALTRELVKLMEGSIEVKSKPEQGTTFMVHLPITQEAKKEVSKPIALEDKVLGFTTPTKLKNQQKTGKTADTGNLPLALIIEDNPDVIRYLTSCLEEDYQVATAQNGKTGVDIALDIIPDIIVSDVMMPEMDGYEACEILKEDERTSHIPIILLTAKADRQSRLEGLRRGADAYLAKPFNREELQVRLEQLIELRRKLQERYANLEEVDLKKEAASLEDTFLQKVKQVILDHISDTEFGQIQLSRAIGLSRSQLFRKLKALTGKSTALVVRSIRLQKAKELLLSTELNVSEVAYDVGFKDLSYFSKCFMEEFGEQPSSIRV